MVCLLIITGICAWAADDVPLMGNPPPQEKAAIRISLYWDRTLQRAGGMEQLCARLENLTDRQLTCIIEPILPPELRLKSAKTITVGKWQRKKVYAPYFSTARVVPEKNLNAAVKWDVEAAETFRGVVRVVVSGDGVERSEQTIEAQFLPAIEKKAASYVPKPKPLKSKHLVGAMYFPGWKPGHHVGWSIIEPYPERKSALGWYDESDPEVTDWQIKWALEHGISFFMYCWFRDKATVGEPVQQMCSAAIHEGLFKSRYGSMFKFCIMWENGNAGGVASVDDLMENMMPYWMSTYFKRSNYLIVDNKPVIAVYDIAKLMENLGGTANVKAAITKMREYCVAQGFSGLWVLAENRQTHDPYVDTLIAQCGLDASFAYCWQNIPNKASADIAVTQQIDNLAIHAKWGVIPQVPTLSMGWDSSPYELYCGWGPHTLDWCLPPADFETLCRKSESFIGAVGGMVLLDNWNEWGEGHYIAPCRQNGFGYLDAVRKVFGKSGKAHVDLLPENVGLGPYETCYKEWLSMQEHAIGY